MPARSLPPRPDLDHLKHQAKDLRDGHAAGDADALRRIAEFHPRLGGRSAAAVAAFALTQADALLTVAREYGFSSWPKLKRHVEGLHALELRVQRLRAEFAAGDAETRRRLLKPAHDVRRFERYDPHAPSISDLDARLLVANEEGYAFWNKYESFLHLDPAVRDVIAAVRSGDREGLLAALREEPRAANPFWVSGFAAPRRTPNDSIPLFCVCEGSFRATNTRGNEYELVRDLAAAGASVDVDGGVPLVAATSFGVLRAAEALLDCGAAVDGVDGDGTPLAFALHFGYTAIAELLARRGAKTDLRFDAGLGKLDAVKRWFAPDGSLPPGAGALVDPYADAAKYNGESPFRCERTRANVLSQALYFACSHGRLDVAEYLLEQGAEIDTIVPGLVDFRGTVLHRVASMDTSARGRPCSVEQIVRFLHAHGARLDARDEVYDGTPSGWARHMGRHETVELLRSLGSGASR
ncbi:MAG TPA: ankyrin repeat domain-containing protein [Gammaproteobacteria bacterium]|nr:ankyrin repeat domain-containing protein [Gammaproteobacteria bacterium]